VFVAGCGGTDASTTVAPGDSTTTAVASERVVSAVTFTTGDGLVLEGLHYEGEATWVVLGHMFPSDMTAWDDLALTLQRQGYSVLAYNNRGYGNSMGERQSFDLAADASAAIAFARESGARRVVYGGASMNGLTALHVAANDAVQAVFALSPVLSMPGLDAAAAYTTQTEEPVLILAAEDDGTAAADAQAIFDQLSTAVPPRTATTDLRISSAGGHGTDLLDPSRIQEVVDWIIGMVSS
jgi:pimeloyl-ACP methyl ester carboxylesterase